MDSRIIGAVYISLIPEDSDDPGTVWRLTRWDEGRLDGQLRRDNPDSLFEVRNVSGIRLRDLYKRIA